MDEYEDYEYQTIHNLDPDSLNLSFYSDKYIFNKIFVFGTFFNIVLWVCGCVFCGPCFVVLCQIWLITRAFDSSAILGICVLACCCGNQNRISSARNNV